MRSVSLVKLLSALEKQSFTVHGNEQVLIEKITWDYSVVRENTLYFCLENEEFQENYIHENSLFHWRDAVDAGATCLVVKKGRILDCPESITRIEVDDVNTAMAWIAKEFYAHPFQQMQVLGVTGTNGKTTTSQLLDSIFQVCEEKTGVIGTIGIFYPNKTEGANHLSNPLATELFAVGSQMADEKVKNLLLEITSHGMVFQRTTSIDFDVAIFTNLTQDHLDYHKTFSAYKEAKLSHFRRLGSMDKKAFAIINIDDNAGAEFIQAIPKERIQSGKVQVLTYGIRNQEADLVASPKQMTGSFSEFEVFHKGTSLAVIKLPTPGLFNIYNAIASFGATFSLGIPTEKIVQGLETANQVTGRFEKVSYHKDINVYIDYAHTPDSLENILQSVRPLTKKRLITVFGCGGDRDRTKRSIMGEIAAKLSDIAIVTSDNPRTENPKAIIQEIVQGMKGLDKDQLIIEEDRESAIHQALRTANAGDSVLIAGKGHENYQIIGEKKFPFSDRIVVEEFLETQDLTIGRAWVEISSKILRKNFELIWKDKPKDLKLLAVVKDHGTGHGTLLMAREALRAGANYLGVACLSEALELRKNGIEDAPILIFGERSFQEIPICIEHNLSIQVQSIEQAKRIAHISELEGKVTKVHFKVDTGMGRYGVRWNNAVEVYEQIQKIHGIVLEGIMTHFAQSDEAKKDYANLQWSRFKEVLDELESKQITPPLVHACNTGGYLDLPHAHGDMIRTGILPTGVYPSKVCRRIDIDGEKLEPAMSVKTRIAFLKQIHEGDCVGYGMHFKAKATTTVAVLPFGYGDGYPRIRNQGGVLIRGIFAPILGGNSMDATMVDVTQIPDVTAGDEVVIIGKQEQQEITSIMVADWVGTVCYDVMSCWTNRMERKVL
ncbi:MAG: alanine racemase [bacterium]|jgi:alanine racemase